MFSSAFGLSSANLTLPLSLSHTLFVSFSRLALCIWRDQPNRKVHKKKKTKKQSSVWLSIVNVSIIKTHIFSFFFFFFFWFHFGTHKLTQMQTGSWAIKNKTSLILLLIVLVSLYIFRSSSGKYGGGTLLCDSENVFLIDSENAESQLNALSNNSWMPFADSWDASESAAVQFESYRQNGLLVTFAA